jgi:pimeloyl-ACP methyl ester carboxylesterase
MPYLILHGLEGSGPGHWQSWLAARLRERGLTVAYPSLPDADHPRLERWLEALHAELDRLPPTETTVLCHSLGSLLWLHYAAAAPRVRVARVLLVAPPQPDVDDPQSPGFRPVPLDAEGVASAAGETGWSAPPTTRGARPRRPDGSPRRSASRSTGSTTPGTSTRTRATARGQRSRTGRSAPGPALQGDRAGAT